MFVGERDANLDAARFRNEALALEDLPRDVVALRSDGQATSSSLPSSRTNVAVRPRRLRACSSAVMRKMGAGSRWTSSYTTRPQFSLRKTSSKCSNSSDLERLQVSI